MVLGHLYHIDNVRLDRLLLHEEILRGDELISPLLKPGGLHSLLLDQALPVTFLVLVLLLLLVGIIGVHSLRLF